MALREFNIPLLSQSLPEKNAVHQIARGCGESVHNSIAFVVLK